MMIGKRKITYMVKNTSKMVLIHLTLKRILDEINPNMPNRAYCIEYDFKNKTIVLKPVQDEKNIPWYCFLAKIEKTGNTYRIRFPYTFFKALRALLGIMPKTVEVHVEGDNIILRIIDLETDKENSV